MLNLAFCCCSALASHKDFEALVRAKLKEQGWTDKELDSEFPFGSVENVPERLKKSVTAIIEGWGGTVTYWPGRLGG